MTATLSRIAHSLATADQINQANTRGLSASDVDTLHYTGASLAMMAAAVMGIRTPRVISTAATLFHRFHTLRGFFDHAIGRTAAACLFIACKACEITVTPTEILAAFSVAMQDTVADPALSVVKTDSTSSFSASLYEAELQVLTSLAFDTHVVCAHTLLLEYVNMLALDSDKDRLEKLVSRAWRHVNDALLSRIPVVHQPNVIAITALWLAARETNVELLDGEPWWTAFDVDTEDMGHMVLLLRSLYHTAIAEQQRLVVGQLLPQLTVLQVQTRLALGSGI
ncbi:cyclin-like protein [Dipodascopsis uninucleata]